MRPEKPQHSSRPSLAVEELANEVKPTCQSRELPYIVGHARMMVMMVMMRTVMIPIII